MDGQNQNLQNPNLTNNYSSSQPVVSTGTPQPIQNQPVIRPPQPTVTGRTPQQLQNPPVESSNVVLDSIELAGIILLILLLIGIFVYAIYKVVVMVKTPDDTGGERDIVVGNSGGDDSGGGGDSGGEDWLSLHNEKRKKAWGSSQNLVWDSNLAAGAKDWAAQLVEKIKKEGTSGFQHSNTAGNPKIKSTTGCDKMSSGCGENMYYVWGKSLDPKVVVDAWYDECSKYNGKFTEETGHYTQLVWKDAKKVGCGVSGGVGVCWYDKGNICPGGCNPNVDPSCCKFEGTMVPEKRC
jgi:uncharacterized protein YkwD